MAESAVQSAAAWLGKQVVEEVKYLYDVREKVEELQGELEWMQCFLSDADKRQKKDAVIRKWISQIKDLAYEAEDVLEEFIHKVSYKDRHRGLRSNLRWLSCLPRDARALHQIGTNIDGLTRKVSKLTSRLQTYGLKMRYEEISASPADLRTLELRRTYAHLKDDMIVGIDDDIASLADKLVADQDHKVVVISGMGGLGKTTLAREVYHHRDVRGHFFGFAWAYISQQFQTRTVIIGILRQLIPEKDMARRNKIQGLQDAELPGELFQVLQEKSYLVVLDDMWKTVDWDRLKAAFPVTDPSTGSKILVTTTHSGILSGLGSSVLNHEPKLLDDDNSMRLLLRKAFTTTEGESRGAATGTSIAPTTKARTPKFPVGRSVTFKRKKIIKNSRPPSHFKPDNRLNVAGTATRTGIVVPLNITEGDAGAVDSKMIELGKKMLKHCHGHPLAIIVLRAVLETKKTLEEWQTVNNNIRLYLGRDMPHDQSQSRLHKGLAMSYYDLPYFLKPYFLHLGNFPEDYEIDTKKLYRMWIAEGIVASSSDRTLGQSSLEEEAQYCLIELVQKGMVQVGKVGSKGKIKTCRLHDLMRDICLEIAKEENFICVMDLNQTNQNEPPLVLNEKLHRLAIHVREEADGSLPDPSFEKAPNIRSLLFFPNQGCKQEHCNWMRSVCNNFRLLRVLDLNGFDIGGSLPKEIGNLIHLRFLSLNQTKVTKVPSSIGYLSYLETLDFRVSIVVVRLPNVLWKLRRLKHLHFPLQGYKIERGKMMRLDGLVHLETLENVDIDRIKVKGLPKLKNIKKLMARCVSKKENLDSLLKSSSIKCLSLKIDGSIMDKDQMILSSRQLLHRLYIDNKILGPLRFEMFPENLTFISLSKCEIKNDPMPVFEQLPRLKYLILDESYLGDKMECSAGGFPQLTFLYIIDLTSLREWKVGSGALAKLVEMEIYNSPIEVLPDALPSRADIACDPCVKGIEKYNSCPYYKGQ